MKFTVIASLIIAVSVSAAPQDEVQLLSYENEVGINDYHFSYKLSDGTSREEKGELKNVGTENEALSVQGSYTWTAPDGNIWTITFIADENGFQPKIQAGGGGISGPLVASLLG